jgi:hypothetical protein
MNKNVAAAFAAPQSNHCWAMVKHSASPEITAATSADISRLIAEFEGKRQSVSAELEALSKARTEGAIVDALPSANDVLARQWAAELLNGRTPIDLHLDTRARIASVMMP